MHRQHPLPILHTPELLPVAGPGTWRGHNITTITNITPPRSLPTRNHRPLKRAHNEPIGPYKPCIHNTPRPSSNLGNNNTKQTPAQPPKRAKKPRNSRTRDKKLKHNFARPSRPPLASSLAHRPHHHTATPRWHLTTFLHTSTDPLDPSHARCLHVPALTPRHVPVYTASRACLHHVTYAPPPRPYDYLTATSR